MDSRIKIPQLMVLLGTGWKDVVEKAEVEEEISYKELFGISATVPGHEGKMVIGRVAGKRVGLMVGRVHMYEGFSAREATEPIAKLASLGMKRLVVTSASGALNEKYQVGDLVVLSDLVTLLLSPDNPLKGPEFVDMSECFDEKMREVASKACALAGYGFHEGVYVYYHGPNFETPADKMALKFLGADCVGMSTVPETIRARSLGIEVLGLSFITNLAFVKHSHEEVLAEAKKGSAAMVGVLEAVVKEFGQE